MKGDISADFHAAEKRYSGVRAQAGRVLTEADFNAAFDVIDDRLEALVRTLLCAAGSPDGGLKVTAATPSTLALPSGAVVATYEVEAAPGTFVLGGRGTVANAPIASLEQADWLSLPLTPGELPPAPVAGRTDLVWLELVERPVRAAEDREIQERALGSADTTTRLRPQLRLRLLADVPPECHLAALTLTQTLAAGGHATSADRSETLSAARLGLAFVDDGPALDPCAPAGAAGYLGAENHTLKILLTAPDRFVWAYDHGEPLYRVQVDAAAGEIVFLTPPRDPALYPLPGQVIEILPWDVLLPNGEKAAAALGHRARVAGHYDPPTQRIAYDGSLPPDWQVWLDALPAALLGRDDDPPRFFYARLWQPPTTGAGTDEPAGTGIVLPETGIALHFAGAGIPGDYWTAALRPNAPRTVQPWSLMIDPTAGEAPHAPPIGPRRFHAPLALVAWPNAQGPAVIDDCRNRFRRLCRIRSCCTWQVGDGHVSFGDFDSIQEAINALPLEGGEICLLPGVHDGPLDLAGRTAVKIHGCGFRSRIEIAADPNAPLRPGVRLDGATGIRFCDFAISGAGGPVFGALEPCAAIEFQRLRILARQTAAIALARVDDASVADCRIEAEALPRALEAADVARLLPLVYLAGDRLRVERNLLKAEYEERNRNRVALGGLHIGGSSRDVLIRDNHIEGGNGHGVTLGSLVPPRDGDGGGGVTIHIPPWITIDEDGCVKLRPGGTLTIPDRDDPIAPQSAGPVERLRIRDNRILAHGGCGVSVVHWFIPDPEAELDALDDIEIDEVEIDGNAIEGCMAINLASGLPVDAAFNSGFGGIALASATDVVIADNAIRDCGGAGRSPICGVYLRYAERLRIEDNRISDNGRPASLTDPLLVGNIGGIVLGHVDGVEEALGRGLREAPAAVIRGNVVVAPEGRALELSGSGQMLVQGNTLTSHGNNIGGVLLFLLFALLRNQAGVGGKITDAEIEGQYRAAISQLGGSAVLIVNTGINRNLALFAMAASAQIRLGAFETAVPAASDALALKGTPDAAVNARLPRGPVSFSDNMVTFDALSNAITLSICAIAIVSLDDVGMHDNHSTVDLGADLVLVNALVLGLAGCRLVGNGFHETLRLRQGEPEFIPASLFSAVSFGILNATELNQGSHCFLHQGAKQPQVIVETGANGLPRARLDTNRHLLSDDLCERLRKSLGLDR